MRDISEYWAAFDSSNRNARAPEQLEELCQYVQDTSPVRDIIANAIPVDTGLEVLT